MESQHEPEIELQPGTIDSSELDRDAVDDDIVDELLVEEVSIDGMCGVY